MGIINAYNLKIECERRARKMNVDLKWLAADGTPCSTRTEVWLPRPTSNMTRDEEIYLRGATIHECLHLTRPTMFDIMEKYNDPKKPAIYGTIFSQMLNILEDHTMEHQHSLKFFGDGEDLGRLHYQCTKKQTAHWDGAKVEEIDYEPLVSISLLALNVRQRNPWDPIGGTGYRTLMRALPDECGGIVKLVDDSRLIERWNSKMTPEGVEALCLELYDLLFYKRDVKQKDGTKYPKNPKDLKPSDKAGEAKVGKGGKIPAGSTKDKDKDGKPLKEGHFIVHWRDVAQSSNKHRTPNDNKGVGMDGASMSIDFEGWKPESGFVPYDRGECRVVELNESTAPRSWLTDSVDNKAFAAQVRRLIQSKMRSRTLPEREEGQIHNPNLYRIAVPMVGDGAWNRKIFRTKEHEAQLNTSIHLLIDWSGSMNGVKKQIACLATQRLYEVTTTALRVPTRVGMFGHMRGPDLGIVCDYGERGLTSHDIANRMVDMNKMGGGNSDADALLWALQAMKQRTEERKILIVLSDGCPANAKSGGFSSRGASGPAAGLTQVVKEINELPGFETHGIGIMDRNVERFYPHSRSINKPEELNDALLHTLKAVLLEGL